MTFFVFPLSNSASYSSILLLRLPKLLFSGVLVNDEEAVFVDDGIAVVGVEEFEDDDEDDFLTPFVIGLDSDTL